MLLLGCADERGVLFFPTTAGAIPGVEIAKAKSAPINELLITAARAAIANDRAVIEVDQRFAEVFVDEQTNQEWTLYAGRLRGITIDVSRMRTMPELLRSMSKSRARIAFTKAWQVYSSGWGESVKVVETADLAKRLSESRKEDGSTEQ